MDIFHKIIYSTECTDRTNNSYHKNSQKHKTSVLYLQLRSHNTKSISNSKPMSTFT